MSLYDPAIQQALVDASDNPNLHEIAPTPQSVRVSQPASQFATGDPAEIWTTSAPKPRGRAPNDPHNKNVPFTCQSIEDLESQLRDYLWAPDPSLPPEHTTLQFHFGVDAAFMIYKTHLRADRTQEEAINACFSEKTVISVMNALTIREGEGNGAKEMRLKQRAIARACMEAIARVDHYKYSYNNDWMSKEDQALRFSFFCNDSLWNKMRTVNAGKRRAGQRAHKPVYDCKGYVSVKFSAVKQNLEVSYKHVPCHKTYDERAPPPRRDSKRRRLMEMNDPEAFKSPRKRPEKTSKTPVARRKSTNSAPQNSPINDAFETQAQEIADENVNPANDDDIVTSNEYTSGAPPQPHFPPHMSNDVHSSSVGDGTLSAPAKNATSKPHRPSSLRQSHLSSNSRQESPSFTKPPSRLSAREKREWNITAAKSEIEIMREKLAEAERMVKMLEAENRALSSGGRRNELKKTDEWRVMTVADGEAIERGTLPAKRRHETGDGGNELG
ncbi:MAG: hypothetical protein Q9227_006775 [Pyrenula ochraceoflavens]